MYFRKQIRHSYTIFVYVYYFNLFKTFIQLLTILFNRSSIQTIKFKNRLILQNVLLCINLTKMPNLFLMFCFLIMSFLYDIHIFLIFYYKIIFLTSYL